MKGDRSVRFYRSLLVVLPSSVRQHNGSELEAMFVQALKQARQANISPFRFWREVVGDLMVLAVTCRRGRSSKAGREIRMRKPYRFLLADLLQDMRISLRTVRKRPGFAAVVILTLALGIGVNSAIFGVLRAVVLKPLPYPDPDRLVTVWMPQTGYGFNPLSAPDWLVLRDESTSFESWGVFQSVSLNLSGEGEPERVTGARTTAGFLQALRVRAARGRLFSTDGTEGQRVRVAVVGDGLWRRRFGSDPDLVGREILVNEESWTVIGILPEGFRLPGWRELEEPDILIPMWFGEKVSDRGSYYLKVVGRLRDDQSMEGADAELNAIAARLAKAYPESNDRRVVQIEPVREIVLGDSPTRLWALMGATGFVLLMACANVGGLLLARNTARSVEMSVRASLGAGRGRLVRQLLTESLMLALFGGAAGLFLTWWSAGLLAQVIPDGLPRVDEIGMDWLVALVTLGVTILTAVLSGVVPAVSILGTQTAHSFRDSTRTVASGRLRSRTLGAMVVVQLSLGFILADGAVLMLQSLRETTANPELREFDQILLAGYLQPDVQGAETIVSDPFLERFLEEIRGVPGVEQAGASTTLPLMGRWASDILPEGLEYDTEADLGITYMVPATRGYFEAVGIDLLLGRDFVPEDLGAESQGVVVNESFAERSWPGESPLGKRIRANVPEDPWLEATVVGVVEDVRQNGLETRAAAGIYLPFFPSWEPHRWVALRTAGDPRALIPVVKRKLSQLDPHRPLTQVFTGAELYESMAADRRFTSRLVAFFALAALALAAAGTYGLMSFLVRQRTHEIGIRIALGATSGGVVWVISRLAMGLVVVGIVIGVFGVWVVSGVLENLIFGVAALNPSFMLVAGVSLAVVAGTAAVLPASRATRIDPTHTIRAE